MIKELIKSFLNFRNIKKSISSKENKINTDFNIKLNRHEFEHDGSILKDLNYMDKIDNMGNETRTPSNRNINTS